MTEYVFKIFSDEIKRQCEFSFIALKQMECGLQNKDVNLIWYSIQNFLVAIANISKILWPIPKYKGRGEELRKKLKISENSLIKSRKFRNHFEHFDERLEKWLKTTKHYNYVDSNIGDIKLIKGIDVEDIHRNFNPNTMELIFRGEKYDLQAVKKEVEKIYKNLDLEKYFQTK